MLSIQFYIVYLFGEVPKLAEGTPLERVQVVNSGARVQIPPSPLSEAEMLLKKSSKNLLTKAELSDKISKFARNGGTKTKHFDN